jgi:hypothetical protein
MSRAMMSRLGLWAATLFLTASPPWALSEPNLHAEGGATAADSKLDAMPRSLEIRFALSALPPPLRDKATVYVLDPGKGYVRAIAGTNGQSCMVERTVWGLEYRNDHYAAICDDAAGANSQMRLRFDVAELRARGLTSKSAAEEIKRRVAKGAYPPPERAGISYMVAPLMRTYPSPSARTVSTMVMPHVMYYAPNVGDADIGGVPPPPMGPYPFVMGHGPLGYIVQPLGEHEAAQIVSTESELVKDLCAYRSYLCLSSPETKRSECVDKSAVGLAAGFGTETRSFAAVQYFWR